LNRRVVTLAGDHHSLLSSERVGALADVIDEALAGRS